MGKEEFDIEISSSGEVKVTFQNMTGSHVIEYVELLTRMIGKLKEEEIHIRNKRYPPEPKVGIVSSDITKVTQRLKKE